MTPLLLDLVRHGVRLRVVDGRLAYDGPAGNVPTELVRRIKACRDDLLELLATPEGPPLTVMIHPPAEYRCENPRRQPVVDLLDPVYHADPDRYIDLRDAWQERIAICAEAGVTDEAAEAVALTELRESLTPAKADAAQPVRRPQGGLYGTP